MFGKKKNDLNYETKNHKMKDNYNTDNLVCANLEYISSSYNLEESPAIEKTKQRYIFEKINEKDKTRYKEIFTGFIADKESSGYFDLPYVVDISPLTEFADVGKTIHKSALLLVMDDINYKQQKNNKKR